MEGHSHEKANALLRQGDIAGALLQHFEDDKENFSKLATKEDVQEVKESVAELVTLLKNFKIGIHISGRVFGFSARAVMWFGGFMTAVIAIAEGFHMFGKEIIAFLRL